MGGERAQQEPSSGSTAIHGSQATGHRPRQGAASKGWTSCANARGPASAGRPLPLGSGPADLWVLCSSATFSSSSLVCIGANWKSLRSPPPCSSGSWSPSSACSV